MTKTNKIFINGAYGGLGTDISEYLTEKKYEVIKSNPKIDINNKEEVEKEILTIKPDIVIHLAAMVGTKDCEEIPEQAIKTNILGTLNVVNAVKKANAKFIYFSTTAIYKPGEIPIYENSKIDPTTIYGKTKYWGECIAKEYISKNNLLIIRPCFGFGGTTDVSMLGALIRSHYTHKWVNLLLNMKKKKDYTFVRNISYALYLMLKNDAFGKEYNVSHGHAIEYGELIKKLTDRNIYPLFKNFPEKDYMGDHIVSNEKITKELNYKPIVSLDEGMKIIIDKYKKIYEQRKNK